MLVETFLRKQLGLKAHTVTQVEETERFMVVHIDRLGSRLLRCGLCRQRCRKVHSMQKPRVWRALQAQPLAAAEESVESQRRPERAPVDAGAVEHAHRARLLPQRSLSVVLGLPAAQTGRRSLGEMDAFGHAFPAGSPSRNSCACCVGISMGF